MTLIPFDYKVIRRERKKTASLQVSPSNEVSIIVPLDLEESEIHKVVKQKTQWVLKKIRFNNEVKYPYNEKEYVSGEAFTYLGRNYRLKVIEGDKNHIELKNGRFDATITNATQAQIKDMLTTWYMQHAEIKLIERVRRFQSRLGVSCQGIKVKTLRRQWGSCTKDAMINFNWKIIVAPMTIVDYVVVHELCHLKYNDHSKQYWKLLERVMPDYLEHKEWLRVNGAMLGI